MSLKVKHKDIAPICDALANWWHSQEIGPEDATFIMVRMSACLTAHIADDKRMLDEGVKILVRELEDSANLSFRKMRK